MKISSIDITEALKKAHKHNNYDVIEKITENSKGEMLYDSKPLSSSELSSASLGSVIYDIPSKSVVADTDSIVFFDKTLKTTKKIKISNLKYMIKNIGAKFALFVGGQFETNGKTIDYVNFKTYGNATEFGSLQAAKSECGSAGTKTKAFLFGGYFSNTFVNSKTVEVVDFSSKGNSVNYSELTSEVGSMNSANNEVISVFTSASPSVGNFSNFIMATKAVINTAIAILINTSPANKGGLSNQIKCFFSQGTFTVYKNYFIFYATMASLGDFGSLSALGYSGKGTSNKIKGIVIRGLTQADATKMTSIDYFNVAITNTCSNFATLSSKKNCCSSNDLKAVFAYDNIEEIFYDTSGAVSDFGSLTNIVSSRACSVSVSNGHGGLTN